MSKDVSTAAVEAATILTIEVLRSPVAERFFAVSTTNEEAEARLCRLHSSLVDHFADLPDTSDEFREVRKRL